jgi:hypothetical protein
MHASRSCAFVVEVRAMIRALALIPPLAASAFGLVATACSSSSGPAAASDSGADQSAADVGAVDTGSPDGESIDTGSVADSSTAADTEAVAEGGPATDGGGDSSLAACQQTCEANDMAGFDKFVEDVLATCACVAGSACNADCVTECADASTLTMGSTCAACLRMQTGASPRPVCVTTAGTLCFGDSTCDSFLACVQGC